MAAAEFTFEGCYGCFGILARLWLNSNVCVRWFPVDCGAKCAVVMPGDMDIKECNGIFLFFLSCELYSGVHCIEAIIKVRGGVTWGCGLSESLPLWRL